MTLGLNQAEEMEFLLSHGFTKPQAENELARRKRVAACDHTYVRDSVAWRSIIIYVCTKCDDSYEKDVS